MSLIDFDLVDKIGLLQIDREQSLNALNQALLEELEWFLHKELRSLDLRALILTGKGKAFIAGADIKEMREMDSMEMLSFCSLGQQVGNLLERAPFLTLAAVNGYALGGGLEMALACDFIYAAEDASLGLPEVGLGLIPGFGGTQRLARAVGTRAAKELCMSGRVIDAKEAAKLGIVNRLCSADQLIEEAKKTAQEIVSNSFTAVLQAKRAINHGVHLAMTEALALERNMCATCFATNDRLEGMNAFIEKRQPQFD